MNAVENLYIRIRQALSSSLNDADWDRSRPMARVLDEVSSVFDTAAEPRH
jgi:hypothetical protein